MSKPISEVTKRRIAELYNNGDLSIGLIAQALGVSERTVQRYKNYNSLDQPRQISNREARPNIDPDGQLSKLNDQTIENTGRSSQMSNQNGNVEPDVINFFGGNKHVEPQKEEFEWECENCGTEWNGLRLICPGCGCELDIDNYD